MLATLALAAMTTVSSPPHASGVNSDQAPAVIHQVEWGCGHRCQYWRHRHWEERRWREHSWRHEHYYGRPYSYNYGHSPYGYSSRSW
jgi:hypothetical protein